MKLLVNFYINKLEKENNTFFKNTLKLQCRTLKNPHPCEQPEDRGGDDGSWVEMGVVDK